VWEDGGTAAEPHPLAQVISPLSTKVAGFAIHASFDSYALTRDEVFDTGTDGGNYSGCFMT